MNIIKPKNKVCPRCKCKNPLNANKCEECGLVFSRLDYTSNSLAKKMIIKGDKDAVVYTSVYPSDINKIMLIIYTIFLGIFGGHCFYVGRYKRAVFMLVIGLASVLCCALSFSVMEKYIYILQIPVGILGFFWLFDIAAVILGKFKIPVSIDYTQIGGKK